MVFRNLVISLLLMGTVFMTVGCTSSVSSKNQNRETVETVLKNNFNGPDKELKKIINNMEGEQKLESLQEYEDKKYKEFFASENAYEDYVSRYASRLWVEALRNKYILNVQSIELEEVDVKDSIYDFTIEVKYKKDGSDSSAIEKVSGQANLNDNHKIEHLLIRADNLMRKLR